jgi:hypothetical protein
MREVWQCTDRQTDRQTDRLSVLAARRCFALVAAVAFSLVFAGAAHALSVEIVLPDTTPAEIEQYHRTAFEAVCRDARGTDLTGKASFTWDFGDRTEPVVGNPAGHRFDEHGKFRVSVTATLGNLIGTDEITVIVSESDPQALRHQPGEDDFEFYARVGAHLFDEEVCDGVQLVVQQTAPHLGNYFWGSARFDHFVDGDWVEGPMRYVSWSGEMGEHATESWDTLAHQNEPVQWRARLFLDDIMAEPPDFITLDLTETWTPDNTVVKATGPDLILHRVSDASHTISWDLMHYAGEEIQPTFTVTVTIHDLVGTVVATLTSQNVTVGTGSVDWDTNLPAASGIYTYRIFAEHGIEPAPAVGCDDSDKSTQLTISNVSESDFEWIDVPTTAQITLDYELSRDAASCTLRVYNNDLEEVTVVSPAGGVLDASAGPQTVVAVFEDANEGVGRYRFVISAEETTGDGELNRDLQPKPALQKGANHASPVSANFGMNGSIGDLGNYGSWAQSHVDHARASQRNRGFGPWEDSEGHMGPDEVGKNADHVRRAISEVRVFSFYGHAESYPNAGNAIVTRQRTLAKDGALATTASVADALSDNYVAYGLIDPSEGWTASSYSGTRLVGIFACNSYKTAHSIAAFLKKVTTHVAACLVGRVYPPRKIVKEKTELIAQRSVLNTKAYTRSHHHTRERSHVAHDPRAASAVVEG